MPLFHFFQLHNVDWFFCKLICMIWSSFMGQIPGAWQYDQNLKNYFFTKTYHSYTLKYDLQDGASLNTWISILQKLCLRNQPNRKKWPISAFLFQTFEPLTFIPPNSHNLFFPPWATLLNEKKWKTPNGSREIVQKPAFAIASKIPNIASNTTQTKPKSHHVEGHCVYVSVLHRKVSFCYLFWAKIPSCGWYFSRIDFGKTCCQDGQNELFNCHILINSHFLLNQTIPCTTRTNIKSY